MQPAGHVRPSDPPSAAREAISNLTCVRPLTCYFTTICSYCSVYSPDAAINNHYNSSNVIILHSVQSNLSRIILLLQYFPEQKNLKITDARCNFQRSRRYFLAKYFPTFRTNRLYRCAYVVLRTWPLDWSRSKIWHSGKKGCTRLL